MKREELIEKWLEALESGEYKQTYYKIYDDSRGEPKYCCLGVVCEVAGKNLNRIKSGLLPKSLAKFLELTTAGAFKAPVKIKGREYRHLAALNDMGKFRFPTIA
jgi:hypothetical protein